MGGIGLRIRGILGNGLSGASIGLRTLILVSVELELDCYGCGFGTIRGGIRIGITRFSGVSIDCGVNGTRFSGDGVSGIGLGITGYSAENKEGEG